MDKALMELLGSNSPGQGFLPGGNRMAKMLLKANMNPAILRTNATLRHEEWKLIDRDVLNIARQRLAIVNYLVSKGLTYNLSNAMGITVIHSQNRSDMSAAQMDMDGLDRGTKDRPDFGDIYLPIPITHKSFNYSSRELAVSRNGGQPLDTLTAQDASRKVSELIEETFVNGSYTFGGGTLQGFTNYTYRNTISLSEQWDDSNCTGEDILGMVLNMIDGLHDDNFNGPYCLMIPGGYGATLADDFKTNSDKSIYVRLKEIPQISDILIADYLTAHNVVMFQTTSDVVQAVVGMQPTNVEWETEGGLNVEFKTMAIIVPRLRCDQDGRCGIIHMS